MKRIVVYPRDYTSTGGPLTLYADQVLYDSAPVEDGWLRSEVASGKTVLIVNRDAVVAMTVYEVPAVGATPEGGE